MQRPACRVSVSSVLSEWNRPGRGMRVVLTSPSVGSGLAGQIRATLDQPEVDAKWPEAAERRLAAAEDVPTDDTDVRADAQSVDAARIEAASTPVMMAAADDAQASAAGCRGLRLGHAEHAAHSS